MQKHTKTQLVAISLVFIYLGIMVLGGLDTITGFVSSSKCGNNVCETEENAATCPDDCVATCGDNLCEEAERYTCVMDCKDARTAKIEEKAYSVGAVWIVFAASVAVLVMAVALISQPRKTRRKRKSRRR